MEKTFIRAAFQNTARTLIGVVWSVNGKDVEQTIRFDVDNPGYQNLLNYITLDELHANTDSIDNQRRENYLALIKKMAAEDGMLHSAESLSYYINMITDAILEGKSVDPEELFKSKLHIFESDVVKNCRNRELKAALRKATSIREIYEVLFQIFDSNEVVATKRKRTRKKPKAEPAVEPVVEEKPVVTLEVPSAESDSDSTTTVE